MREIVSSIGVKDSEREREGFEGGEVVAFGPKRWLLGHVVGRFGFVWNLGARVGRIYVNIA